MSNNDKTASTERSPWEITRTIWSAGGVDLPEEENADNMHYQNDLKSVVGTVISADGVNRADRTRTKKLKQLAEECRSLSNELSNIDGPSLDRMAGCAIPNIEQILNVTVSNLFLLAAAMENAREPKIPHKRKHETNDMAIIILADIFESGSGAKASVTKHWEDSTRSGKFVDFVLKFYELMLSDFPSEISPRSIQASLEKRPAWAASQPDLSIED